MFCKHCKQDKPIDQMFTRKLNGKTHGGIQTLDICKECHRLASSRGGLGKQSKIKSGYLVAINSVSYDHEHKLNEFIFLSFCQEPMKIIKLVKSMAITPIIVCGQWRLDNQQFNQITSEIKDDLYHDKWYFFSQKVKNVLMGLAH